MPSRNDRIAAPIQNRTLSAQALLGNLQNGHLIPCLPITTVAGSAGMHTDSSEASLLAIRIRGRLPGKAG
jgi:hypothetical protein